jgi:protein TonB
MRAVFSESTLVSVAIHVAGMAAILASGASPVEVARRVTEGLVFLAPPPVPSAGPVAESERLRFAELAPPSVPMLSDLVDPMAMTTQTAIPVTAIVEEPTRGRDQPERAAAAVFDQPAPTVYFAYQVESPAAFDSRSAAPAYPDSLQRAGIEGSVIAQFIVDTTGRVETGTLVVLESTHLRFTESVEAAVPNMLFRPAVLSGMKTRQLVQIPFRFRIDRDTAMAPGRVGAPPPPPPPPPGATDS